VKAAKATKVVGQGKAWPWSPVAKFEDADVFALQAIAAGNASTGQQQRGLAFIRNAICEGERLSFMPGGEDGRRATDFAEGKRFVAVQIRRFLNMRPETVNPRGAPPAMPGDKPST
jgi:hypothetical protein